MRRSEPFGLLVGDSVRVRLPGTMRVGGIAASVDPVRLRLRTQGLEALWPVEFMQMASLDVFRQRSPREGFRSGVATGLAVGVFVGVAAGLILHASGVWEGGTGGPGERLVRSGMRLGGLGAAGGAVLGGFIGGARPGVGWNSIPLPRGGARGR